MEEGNYLKQLHDIQEAMNRSTRFLSLSGASGILAGIYALIGAFVAHTILKDNQYSIDFSHTEILKLILVASSVLSASVCTGIILTLRKARKSKTTVWNSASKRFLINIAIPLFTGGAFGMLLLQKEFYGLIAPITLLFYGLALVNASRYTFETVRSMGILFIILGLINTQFVGYGLYFWAFGFGVCHILYGTYMYLKFDKK